MGRETTYTYRTRNRIVTETVTNPGGGRRVTRRWADGPAIDIAGNAAQPVTYNYGTTPEGLRWTETHPTGHPAEFNRTFTDMLGRTVRTERPSGDGEGIAATVNTYLPDGRLVSTTDSDGLITLYEQDPLGRERLTALDINGNGEIDFTGTDRISRQTSHYTVLDDYGPAQVSVNYQWETEGDTNAVEHSRSIRTLDGRHNWNISHGLTNYTETVLDAANAATLTINHRPDGTRTESYRQNGLQRWTRTYDATNGLLEANAAIYDEYNRTAAQSNAYSGLTLYTYYDDGRVKTVTTPDPDPEQSGEGLDPITTTYFYSGADGQPYTIYGGERRIALLPDGREQISEHDARGQLRHSYGGDGGYRVAYRYDYAGRMIRMTTWRNDENAPSGGDHTRWIYNNAGLLEQKLYSDNKGPSYTYTPGGRLLTRTWARGIVTTYGYTAAGELNAITYSCTDTPCECSPLTGCHTPSISYTHDRRGRQTSITDAAGTRTIEYECCGHPVREEYTSGIHEGSALVRSYDAFKRASGITLFTGDQSVHSVAYEYDNASRMHSIAWGADYRVEYSYLPGADLISGWTHFLDAGEIMNTTREFDALNRMTLVENTTPSAVVSRFDYQYNAANQRTRRTEADGAYWSYSYDKLGQVINGVKKLADGTILTGQDFSYWYDDIGNRRQSGIGTNAFSRYYANLLNQYTSRTVPGVVDIIGTAAEEAVVTVNNQATERQGEYFHKALNVPNEHGTTTTPVHVKAVLPAAGPDGADIVAEEHGEKTIPGTPQVFTYDLDGNMLSDGKWNYVWNGENRLVMASNSTHLISYAYDYRGRMYKKTVDGIETRYMWDDMNIIAELSASHTNYNVWGIDLSGSLQGAGGVGGLLAVSTFNVSLSTFHVSGDANGNVCQYVDESGTVVAHREYSPFGETIALTGDKKDDFIHWWSTKPWCPVTEMSEYEFRKYSPELGRWLNRDPIGERGGLNVYGFVGNQSSLQWDYLGLAWSGSIDENGGSLTYTGPTVSKPVWGGIAGYVKMKVSGTAFVSSSDLSRDECVDPLDTPVITKNNFSFGFIPPRITHKRSVTSGSRRTDKHHLEVKQYIIYTWIDYNFSRKERGRVWSNIFCRCYEIDISLSSDNSYVVNNASVVAAALAVPVISSLKLPAVTVLKPALIFN